LGRVVVDGGHAAIAERRSLDCPNDLSIKAGNRGWEAGNSR